MQLRGGSRISSLGGGGALKIIAPSGGRRENFGMFRVKNHDFTPKNHIFSNCGGRRENFWGISCEKSRFYAQKILFFPTLGGARAGCPPPSGSAPAASEYNYKTICNLVINNDIYFFQNLNITQK